MPDQPITDEAVDTALQLFGSDRSVTRAELDLRKTALLDTWHPDRYANLTNNPKQYMQSYTKGEAMTRAIESAYQVLCAWLTSQKH
ncbi:MAG: hypothetical protein ACKOBZ_02395 [Nitrospira sp.]